MGPYKLLTVLPMATDRVLCPRKRSAALSDWMILGHQSRK